MKALHYLEHGGIEKLRFGELPEVKPQKGEVLVKVRACAINHLDLWVLQGWPGLTLPMPHIGGADISGEVHSLGEGVKGWNPGDRVVLYPGVIGPQDEWTKKGEHSVSPGYRILGEGRRGGFAEYVSIPAENLLALPEDVGFSEGAAPLLVGLTAWRMLKHRAKLQKGETVVVVGSGGGLNSFSIQLAKFMGARVIALTSTPAKLEKSLALGADYVIDYTKNPGWNIEVHKLTDRRGADVVIDNVGAKTISESLRAAARGGRVITVGNTSGANVSFDNRYLFVKQLSIIGSTMGSPEDFKEVMNTIWGNQKHFRPIIDRAFPLKDGKNAYKLLQEGRQFGKVIVVP